MSQFILKYNGKDVTSKMDCIPFPDIEDEDILLSSYMARKVLEVPRNSVLNLRGDDGNDFKSFYLIPKDCSGATFYTEEVNEELREFLADVNFKTEKHREWTYNILLPFISNLDELSTLTSEILNFIGINNRRGGPELLRKIYEKWPKYHRSIPGISIGEGAIFSVGNKLTCSTTININDSRQT